MNHERNPWLLRLGLSFLVIALILLAVDAGKRAHRRHAIDSVNTAITTITNLGNSVEAEEKWLVTVGEQHLSMQLRPLLQSKGRDHYKKAANALQNAQAFLKKKEYSAALRECDTINQAVRAFNTSHQMKVKKVAELEQMKKDYLPALSRCEQTLRSTRSYIDGLLKEGYFDSHFLMAENFYLQGERSYRQGVRIARRRVERNLPDYVTAWQLAVQGQETAQQSRSVAHSVPDLRFSNERSIQQLRDAYQQIDVEHVRAVHSAEQVEDYYPLFQGIRNAWRPLSSMPTVLDRLQESNSLRVQEFEAVQQSLGQFSSHLTYAQKVFRDAQQCEVDLANALRNMESTQSDAEEKIGKASQRINTYAHPYRDQDKARKLLQAAREAVDRGKKSEEGKDPIKAYAEYQDGLDKAEKAYKAVDVRPIPTPTPTVDPEEERREEREREAREERRRRENTSSFDSSPSESRSEPSSPRREREDHSRSRTSEQRDSRTTEHRRSRVGSDADF